jgi:hypothetical protein
VWQGCCIASTLFAVHDTNQSVLALPPPQTRSKSALQPQVLRLDANSLTGPLPSAWATLGAGAGAGDATTTTTLLDGTAAAPPADSRAAHTFSGQPAGPLFILPATDHQHQLLQLSLAGNSLSGMLPDAWGGLGGLQTLDLSFNALTGPLPPSWAGLAALRELWLGVNRLQG